MIRTRIEKLMGDSLCRRGRAVIISETPKSPLAAATQFGLDRWGKKWTSQSAGGFKINQIQHNLHLISNQEFLVA
jgi:hypothetical protein